MEVEQGGPQGGVTTRPVRARLRSVVEFGTVGAALVHPLATLAGRYDWRMDLLTHFQGAALLATALALAIVLRPRPRMALVLAGLLAFQIVPLVRYQGRNPVKADPRSRERLRILMANVLCENQNFDTLARLIRQEQPDIVGLVEYDKGWARGLEDVRRLYPYHLDAPRGARGVALWFREPPRSLGPVQEPLPGGWPFLHATFEFGGLLRHLWLIHPSSPFERRGLPELSALARIIRDEGGSQIVVGDMNSTEGSPRFTDFLELTGLRDSRLGFGRQPSWPVGFPYRIAIDHAFVSGDLAVVDRRLGPSFGSDHAPLILDLAPAAGTALLTSSASSSKSK